MSNLPDPLYASNSPFSVLRSVFKWATAPVWYPAKLAFNGAAKALWTDRGWRGRVVTATLVVPTLAAATTGAGLYSAAFGTAILADTVAPAAQGRLSGTVLEVKEKGAFWPCKTWDVTIAAPPGTDERTTLSVRRFMAVEKPPAVTALQQAAAEGKTVDVAYFRSRLGAERFSETPEGVVNTLLSCVQKSPNRLGETPPAPQP